MLGALRKRKNSPIITILLGLTALLMIGFGVSFQGLSSAGTVAHVNGEPINELDFNARYTVTFRERQRQDRRYDRTQAEKDGLREQVLNGMMNDKILSQKGAEMGLAVDDQALRQAITTNPQFQTEDGRFDISRYKQVLNYMRSSDNRFEKQYREQLLAQPMTSLLQVIGPSEAEVRAKFEREERKLSFSFVQLPKAEYAKTVGEVSDADVAAWKAATEDVDAAVQAYYEKNKRAKYDLPKRVCAQHVLVKMDESLPPDEQQKRAQKIQDALAAIKKGEDFGEVAKKYSDDSTAQRAATWAALAPARWFPPSSRPRSASSRANTPTW